ncbi:hypothetical protein, partial [Enterococcus faecalis]|uniref:hypothetical protein n=1 Tax=Enterococcus faecalis TaxID=1351 RepID=UPI003D6B0601
MTRRCQFLVLAFASQRVRAQRNPMTGSARQSGDTTAEGGWIASSRSAPRNDGGEAAYAASAFFSS